jgi:hypothetical protein
MGNLEITSESYKTCGFCGRRFINGLIGVESKLDQGQFKCIENTCHAIICRECITQAFTLIEEGRET